jgi:hypothetical protein
MSGSTDIQKIVSTMEFKRGLAVLFDDKTRKIEMLRIRPRLTLHTGIDANAIPEQQTKSKVKEDTQSNPVITMKRAT